MITTSRLLLRPWKKSDLAAMSAINADPEVMRYFPATQSHEETKAFISRQHVHQQEHGYCYFAAELGATGALIGFIGLNYQTYEAPFSPATDIGWRLHPDFWRRGLATEGAAACLKFAAEQLALPEVVSVAVTNNRPSICVMEKIGLSLQGYFEHPALRQYPDLKRCVWYSNAG